jgi:hypothetical protein
MYNVDLRKLPCMVELLPADIPKHMRRNRFFRPREDTSFFLLDGQTVVFCEAHQKIYALNPSAAFIWCCLEAHEDPAAICRRLAANGLDLGLATRHVHEAIKDWLKLGLLNVDPTYFADNDKTATDQTFLIKVANLSFTICCESEHIIALLTPFAHFADCSAPRGHVLVVKERDGLVHVFHNDHRIASCNPFELAPVIKAYITERILVESGPHIVFHAACLVRDQKSILISGRPGAGKTTLALRLVADEFAFGGDDMVIIGPDGRAAGVPFAPAIKPGAWDIAETLRPDLKKYAVCRRPDGKRVRYLKPENLARNPPHAVGWIIFIRRKTGAASLNPIDRVEALRRLMDASHAIKGRLDFAKCNALRQVIENAGLFELTYANLSQASEAIRGLFHPSPHP